MSFHPAESFSRICDQLAADTLGRTGRSFTPKSTRCW
jgi:hypothetical protein